MAKFVEAFKARIPLYIVIFILFIIGSGIILYVSKFRDVVYRYDVSIPGADSSAEQLQYGSWPALSNANFFQKVKSEFIVQNSTFIEADLTQMKLRIYKNGSLQNELNILSKGKPGSWWETPAGLYKIESKNKNLFSGFGHVYMPWAMDFEGNFFIHGWPYYPDGTAVASTYSGGCIRLSTEDAKTIYDNVEVGTPVLVFENSSSSDSYQYGKKVPEVNALEYLAVDLQNNFVFTEKDPAKSIPIASITKLITGLVAAEYINLDKEITVAQSAIVTTSKPRLYPGQTISAFQLFYPLLTESSNEAAMALADSMGRSRFVNLMNQKAKSIGMTDSHFTDPAGMNADNVASPQDLFNLAKYLYNNRSFILKISAGRLYSSAYGSPIFNDLQNFNIFSEDSTFIGGKVGKSGAAQETMLALFNENFASTTRPIAIIVLGSNESGQDVSAIRKFVADNYQ
ncbi:MAG: L,D-transpeptidase family protein [Candidatus Paceibacterales bacterium]